MKGGNACLGETEQDRREADAAPDEAVWAALTPPDRADNAFARNAVIGRLTPPASLVTRRHVRNAAPA